MENEKNDDKTADAIVDLMDMELGDSSAKQDVSARSKFNTFLQTVEHGWTIETLRKRDDISWQTSMNYLSSVKRQLETITKTELFKRESEWYKRCRRNLHQQFVLQAIKTGKRLKDQAPMMALEDLEEMGKQLFLENKTTALMDRTLLNNQWLSIGRSSDIGNLRFDDLHWLDRFLVIDVTR